MTRVSVYTNTNRRLGLYVLDCPSCGVIFGVDNDYDERRREDCKNFYCPNGHHMSYSQTEADKLRKENDRLRSRWLAEVDQKRAAEREAAEAKASEIRLRWRVGNGVCPCCNRTFPGLASHVAAKHPDFLTDDLDRLSARMVQILAAIRKATETENAAVIASYTLPGDLRTIRALERRNLVTEVRPGHVALTEHGWPLAEKAAART